MRTRQAVDVTPRSAPDAAPVRLESLLSQILVEQQLHRAMLGEILRQLARGRGARDSADVALLVAVVEAIGDRRFTSGQLMAHGQADPTLRAALMAADVTSPRELGALCRRLEGAPLGGFRLERVDEQRDGVVWCVRVTDSQSRTA